jgi:hypothetical protein
MDYGYCMRVYGFASPVPIFGTDRILVFTDARSGQTKHRALRVFGWKYYLFHKIYKIWTRLDLVTYDGQKRLPTGRTCRTSTASMTTAS